MSESLPTVAEQVRARAGQALATGALTAAYYATPDVVRPRPARALVKLALATGVTAISLVQDPPVRRPVRDAEAEPLREVWTRMPPRGRATLVAAGAAFTAASVALIAAGERFIYRRGEARAAAGARLPHVLPALGWGLAAGVLTLVPPADERTDEPVDGHVEP